MYRIDGVMRLDECDQVRKDLQEHLGINLTVVDASKEFLDGLKGIEDPEKKRKFIGMFSVGALSIFNLACVFLHPAHKTEIDLHTRWPVYRYFRSRGKED